MKSWEQPQLHWQRELSGLLHQRHEHLHRGMQPYLHRAAIAVLLQPAGILPTAEYPFHAPALGVLTSHSLLALV